MFKVIEYIIEIVNWIKIVLSPTLIGVVIGLIIYGNYPNFRGFIASVAFSCVGLVIGIIWATRIWKRVGTTNFIARVNASPDIDEAVRERPK
jgi:hypothetical protein